MATERLFTPGWVYTTQMLVIYTKHWTGRLKWDHEQLFKNYIFFFFFFFFQSLQLMIKQKQKNKYLKKTDKETKLKKSFNKSTYSIESVFQYG